MIGLGIGGSGDGVVKNVVIIITAGLLGVSI